MPVITLSTDIGLNDYLVGAIKGQLISAMPDCSIADISHQLSPFDYQQAAYVCGNALNIFLQIHFI
jgi:S-adenosylmethionine hydrolase